MAQFYIRDVPDELVLKVEALATASNQSCEAWLRGLIIDATKQPVVKQAYAIRMYGLQGKGVIRRYNDSSSNVGGGCGNFSEEESEAYKKAMRYVGRNAPGDRERAIGVLREVFEEVFEQ